MKIILSKYLSLDLSKEDSSAFHDELRHILIMNNGDDLPITKQVVALMEA